MPEGARVHYVPITCRTALNRVEGMSFRWSLNPYTGCAHGCVYCYARSYYALAEHGEPGIDFETRILAKLNFADVLRRELSRPTWRGEQVALGTSTDCYQPAEGRFRITRRTLEVLRDHANGLSMVTKSPLVYRDLDLLAELSEQADVKVFFTITTVDLDLWRVLEPGTANPFKRLWAMQRLVEAGVPAGVLLAPILPGITDSVEQLRGVAMAAADHGAAFFGSSALRLKPVVKSHYLGVITEHFPELLPRYERAYPGGRVHAPAEYQRKLQQRVARIRRELPSAFVGPRDRTGRSRDGFGTRDLVTRRGLQLALPGG